MLSTSIRWLPPASFEQLETTKHVTRVCKNARQQVGILYRKFYGHCNSSTLKQLYLSYVRPHLEYAAPVWDPHQQGLINSLESVQKFALKLCTKNWNASYDETLSNCNLPTLAHRRRLLKLSFLFQIVHGNFVFPDAPIERRSPLPFNLRTFSTTSLYRPAARTTAISFLSFHILFLYGILCHHPYMSVTHLTLLNVKYLGSTYNYVM